MFGSVYGVASIDGPLLGGVFTDRLSWRWAFLVNLPVGAVALVIAAGALPAGTRGARACVDYRGATVLAAIATGVVLITSFGERWGWGSPANILLITATVALVALLVPVERRAAAPVLPPAMLGSRTVVFSSLIGFFANAAMFAVLVYLPTYLQIVHGVSATLSGIFMLPLVAGLVVSQSLAGRWAGRVEGLRAILLTGLAANLVGLLLLDTIGGPEQRARRRPSVSPFSAPCSTADSRTGPAPSRPPLASKRPVPTPSARCRPPCARPRWRRSPAPPPSATCGSPPPSPSPSSWPCSSGPSGSPKPPSPPAGPRPRKPSRPPDHPAAGATGRRGHRGCRPADAPTGRRPAACPDTAGVPVTCPCPRRGPAAARSRR